MAPTQALSDDKVAGELKKMMEFIKKEADEKAKEIQLKADEEYEIEKSNIVRSETAAIDSLYEFKLKKAALAQQITKSTIANKTRLKILQAREEILDSIFNEASEKLKSVSKDKKKYGKVMEGLLLEGAYTLLESKITVKVRKNDVELIKSVIPAVVEEFEKTAKKPIEIKVAENEFLPSESSGGVIVSGTGGKIEVNNTLDERLHLLGEESLPAIRYKLFGASKTRKFFD